CGTPTPIADILIINGTRAKRGELPWHAGIYDKTFTPYKQICGGSLISTKLVTGWGLTAADGPASSLLLTTDLPYLDATKNGTREYTPPDRARRVAPDGCPYLAPGRTSEPTGIKSWDKCLEYQMRVIYPCEESKTLMGDKVRRDYCRHNAGELIVEGTDAKLDEIHLSQSIVPACLDVFGGDRDRAVVTGWGSPSFKAASNGEFKNTLQKVTLTKFTDTECRAGPIESIFNNTVHVCYGDYNSSAGPCWGDNGGPLTIINHRLHCMYTMVGITSYGVGCGNPGQPTYYTKISHYVPWIESIVWP
ncbi:hypothetical protein MSG28_014432, partial [Choristoneura fumiferana]